MILIKNNPWVLNLQEYNKLLICLIINTMLTALSPVNYVREAKWSRPFCFYNKDQIFDIKKSDIFYFGA